MPAEQPTSGSTHRTAKGAQRIQELLSVAGELFLERGFAAVAVDDLIARVGGSRRNVYSHFGGKEGLFVAAMTQVCEEIAAPLEQLNIKQRDPDTALSAFARQLLEAILAPRTLAVHRLMVAEGNRFPELAQVMFNAGPRKVIDALATWIDARRSEADPVIGGDMLSTAMAEQFIDLVVGHTQLRVLAGVESLPLSERKIRRIADNAVATFLYGVKTDGVKTDEVKTGRSR